MVKYFLFDPPEMLIICLVSNDTSSCGGSINYCDIVVSGTGVERELNVNVLYVVSLLSDLNFAKLNFSHCICTSICMCTKQKGK